MKKLLIIAILFTLSSFRTHVDADYTTYQDIDFEFSTVKLLENFNKHDFKRYYDYMSSKRRFWGWKTFIAFENEKAYYTRETLYVIENDGYTEIVEKLKFTMQSSVKKQYSVSGNLGLKGGGEYNGFKLGLEQKIKAETSLVTEDITKESVEIKITVDPGTIMKVQIAGEAKVTNGVAKYYRFWRNVKKGGFEIFVITTEYYSITKEKL